MTPPRLRSAPSASPPTTRPTLSGIPFASFWVDEAGSKATANKCFVVAAIKTRHADDLQRAIHSVRETTQHTQELKFGRLNKFSYDTYARVIDVLESSDIRLCATVAENGVGNPFRGRQIWQAHADVVTGLVVANLNQGEIASVHLDGITTPPNQSMGTAVRLQVNRRLRRRVITEAVSLDSKANDLLQVADLLAGAIFFERQRLRDPDRQVNEYKLRITRRLAAAFDVPDLADTKLGRMHVHTVGATPRIPRQIHRSG